MFGAVKLTKIADPDKYSCIGFDSWLHFTLQNFVSGKSVVFGIENSHQFILIKKKDNLVLGKGPTQGLDDTAITAGPECSVYFSRLERQFC